MKVIGYGRCSTAEQARDGVSCDVQHDAVEREAERRGWEMLWLADEGVSGTTTNRPKLQAALALLAAGEATVLVATKVDRLSRSVGDFAGLLKLSQTQGWELIVLDLGVDTASPMGKAMVSMAAIFAELERDFISQRTKDALAYKRLQGVRLGAPRRLPVDVAERVAGMRMGGATMRSIAETLNGEGIPTSTGKLWAPGTVSMVLAQQGVS